jgi:hypothetical protein
MLFSKPNVMYKYQTKFNKMNTLAYSVEHQSVCWYQAPSLDKKHIIQTHKHTQSNIFCHL